MAGCGCPKPKRRRRRPCCPRPRPRCPRPRRRRRSCSKPRKPCMRAGRKTNNGYLNFLRKFRKRCCNMTPQKCIIEGAKKWNCLSQCQKEKYIRAAKRSC